MRYFEADLIKKIPTDNKDELGNKIFGYIPIHVKECRTTEWTADDVNIYGRDITSGSRKILVKPLNEPLKDIVKISIDNNEYDILSKKDLGRWILFVVKGFRI
ncbi:hypothetical protein [Anaerosalibacter massiliensis]|uniref:Phage head-tail joining protein n=1 Tax=Anaerosalibacter massiliensis TaxID=1347392 RepID=A0A9X2MLZ4_9FIRM|nr:hypothetical protein [Anaerosalibacter massiliensis]MCR2045490.1 hypothetical protein [Anaerosalibacter massiliensis]